MVTDQPIDCAPARWARVAVLSLAALLLVLVGSGVLYRSTLGHTATAPALRGLSCRWQGDRVVISGTVYNPNASSQTVTIDRVVMRLAGGTRVELVNSYSPPQLAQLAGHASRSWTTSAHPSLLASSAGQPIVDCTAQAHNWVRGDD